MDSGATDAGTVHDAVAVGAVMDTGLRTTAVATTHVATAAPAARVCEPVEASARLRMGRSGKARPWRAI